jgi:hypothetical protein
MNIKNINKQNKAKPKIPKTEAMFNMEVLSLNTNGINRIKIIIINVVGLKYISSLVESPMIAAIIVSTKSPNTFK